MVKGGVGHDGQLVGQDDLLPQAHQEALDAGGEVIPVLPAVENLLGHRLILHNGAGDELGEEGDVEPHVEQALLGLAAAPGHVQHIAHGLEGEEGDADGQVDDGHRQLEAQQDQVGEDKSQVLEDKQNGQVADNRDGDGEPQAAVPLLPGGYPQAEQVVGHNGAHHHQHEPGLAPGVEEQGGQGQKDVLPLPPLPKGEVVHQKHHRQEQKQEHRAGKKHGLNSFVKIGGRQVR